MLPKHNKKISGCKWKMIHFLFFIFFSFSSCKKFVEIPPPPNRITEDAVYTSDVTAISVLTAIYGAMNNSPFQVGGIDGSISLFAGLSADEYTLISDFPNYVDYYRNELKQLTPVLVSGGEHWAPLYGFIFKINAALEGLSGSSQITPAVKMQLIGEAKFIRAFCYFYLVNLFGDVPLALTTDAKINSLLERSSTEKVYEEIITDLEEAITMLSDDYLDATLLKNTTERTRPTKWAALALLARVYLYTGDFIKAADNATAVINNTTLFGSQLPDLNSVFLKNSQEAIWQIQPTEINFNTQEARNLIIPATGPILDLNSVLVSKQLLSSFEKNDNRAVYGNWIDTTIFKVTDTKDDTMAYVFKYKLFENDPNITTSSGTSNMNEYFMVLRLAEQYLIRAEARVQLGDINGAQDDLNTIRNRAGLDPTTVVDKNSLLSAILHERQVELFSEWGHRWFDLKRTGKIDEVMEVVTPLKANGNAWQSYKQLYPIPLSELRSAPNLKQNAGY
ncbi:RagB/SusD family nutrient uptake outer membrane protein [Longitalea arenae]|uniref:RagB/SusD family nutrient uptake outer membrane protein n=1 Tax=Longitalea arenae TaxID=2812558 RepID=UPI001F0768D2|nr:RagB/SusD family nutrient uptake outer membrane protein [Longitalea arenae]